VGAAGRSAAGANSRLVMRYRLDTNTIIFALKDAQGRSALRIGEASHDEVAICSVVTIS
jgi:predicted nucleic acid-binding protein